MTPLPLKQLFDLPDNLSFGITGLLLDDADITTAVDALAHVIGNRLCDDPVYRRTNRVT